MSIFTKNEKIIPITREKKKSTPPKKKKEATTITPKDLIEVESEFDFSKIQEPDVALFAKYYILLGANGKQAYLRLRNNKVTEGTACVGANRMLRKLRNHPDFWDMLGLGYSDLKDVANKLIAKRPEKAIDIIMKVNKEDTERVEHSGTMKIEFEKDLDE